MRSALFSASPCLGFGSVGALCASLLIKHPIKHVSTVLCVCVTAMLLWFYRIPCVSVGDTPDNIITSPAFGTVKAITRKNNKIFIAIYLNVFDVHQQYYPVDGTIIRTDHDTTGKFAIAHTMEKSRLNEKKIYVIRSKYGNFVITQIAGLLARTIVSYNGVKDVVKRGDRLGMIKFGSRVDIIIPNADKFTLGNVALETKLRGPQSIIGAFNKN